MSKLNNELIIINEETLKDKIYLIRNKQVMLDSDLAKIYGYETKRFNEQVKNNIERFDGEDFMFQLTDEEIDSVRSKISTSRNNYFKGQDGGTRYLPYAFTEQGIYMLMTVLKGDLAVKQSKSLIRLFKVMKDYIFQEGQLLPYRQLIELQSQTINNTNDIKHIKQTMITKNELSDLMNLFTSNLKDEELLILNNQPFKADIAYQTIYKKAKKSIIIIDDYISIKTLQHLKDIENIDITIISDNKGKYLSLNELLDFNKQYPNILITFIKSNNMIHDRYIVLDYDVTKNKTFKIYHLGSSIKDTGNKVSTISQLKDIDEYRMLINKLLNNNKLVLK